MYFEDFKAGMVFESEEVEVQDSHFENFLGQDFVGGYKRVYEEYYMVPKKAFFRGRPIIPGAMTSSALTSFVLSIVPFSKPAIHKTSDKECFKWPVQIGSRLKANITVLRTEEPVKLVEFEVIMTNQDGKEVARGMEGFRVEKRKNGERIVL